MFFTRMDMALAEMLAVLKPGGRAAFLAWGQFEQPFFPPQTVARAGFEGCRPFQFPAHHSLRIYGLFAAR